MRRLFVAIISLLLVTPIVAQVPSAANMTAELAEQNAKREEAERKLLIREAADELEAAQTEQAYNRFENVMGAFSVLITILVIVFGFRTEKAASAAAKQEVAGAKAEIDRLLTEARTAAADAKAAQQELDKTRTEIEALLARTQRATDEAEKGAVQIAETQRSAAKIFDDLNKTSSADRMAIKLSPEDEKIVEAAVEESADKPEADLTINEYKARIGKARYIDKKWDEVLRLARTMAKAHADSDEALAFALNAQGDAQIELSRYVEAVESYGRVIDRFGEAGDADVQKHLMWAMHHKGYCLKKQGHAAEAEAPLRASLPLCERLDGAAHSSTLDTRHVLACAILDQGRAAEAEAEFRALLPLRERVNGSEHNGTLNARHYLARTILDQGRAAEAEAEFRALLPLRERVDGPDLTNTLVTRYCLALAVLENGNPTDATAILAPIAEAPRTPDWRDTHSAHLAFIRARVAEALGDGEAAARWFDKAAKHFAAAYPPDHYYRKQFDAYVAARNTPGGDGDKNG